MNTECMTFDDVGSVTKYVYSAAGQKLRVVHYTAKPNISRTWGVKPAELTASQILQADSTDYMLGGSLTLKNGRIDKYLFDGGYAQATATGSNNDSFAFYFYNRDHLGNVREVVDAGGSVCQVTNYYPFGTPYCDSVSVVNTDLQPYKYNGKELDKMHGLNTYDFGARQHDPILGRWDRMDPLCEKYYNISPYAYCANNPVKYVDPDGREIVISGNRQQRVEVLGYLQSLTNDKLGVKQDGHVVILSSQCKNLDTKLEVGTSLVSSMLSNEHTATISLESGRNKSTDKFRRDASNGKGTDVYISFNPNRKSTVLTKDRRTGKSVTQIVPKGIILGHELIHGYRSMNGEASDNDCKTTYTYKDSNGDTYKTVEKTEELETVGIIGTYKYTENKLRKEHGYNKRIEY